MSTKPIHRILILVSTVSFFGSTAFAAARAINNAPNVSKVNTNVEAAVESQRQLQADKLQLKEQEQQYKIVLQQEPNNLVALEGLVQIRLQTKNTKGVIEPLKKLVQLNPSKQEYKMLLAQVKQQVGK